MSLQVNRIANTRHVIWSRNRFQLGLGLILAAFAPYGIRSYLAFHQHETSNLTYSLLGACLAIVIGYYAYRMLSRYPGVRASSPILPIFLSSYGVILAIFFFLRLDYSRAYFVSSFTICVVWYYIIYFTLQRQNRLRIGVVPIGAVENLYVIPEVAWIRLGHAGTGPHTRSPHVDAIVADLRADIPGDWQRYIADRALGGVLVMHVKQLEESLTGRVAIEHLSENNFGSLIPGILYERIKRFGDLVISVIAMPFLVPLLVVVGVLIRLDSPGPCLFRQQRMGYRGKPFVMFKFRSMTDSKGVAEDPRLAAMTKDDDHRVTRIGKYLRRYRIDELPQVINILRGEMSWIGPRPEAVPLSLWYEAELPFYRYRHIIRPGITGWAQVKQGHVADVDDVLWKLHYDFYYIKNFSFWLDLLIVAATTKTVFNGFGAR